jgi:glycosyltransferase involved in cell wall biosynthesis
MRLALVMIVRDEARCLGRCLSSARAYVDEMIVVDTGSTDATLEIAAAAGARIGRFAWCDDFAAARNASLDLSEADWNLVLDADTWIVGGEDLRKGPLLAGAPFLGLVRTEHQIEVGGGIETSSGLEARLLPRGVRYVGRIHEQPQSALPRRILDLALRHDGYLAAQRRRKGERNQSLLIAALKAAPEDAYLWYKLGVEHDVAARYDEALIAFTEALRLADGEAPWRHSLVVRALNTMTQGGALDQGLALAAAEEARFAASPDFHFAVGALFLECAARDEANALGRWLPFAETRWLRCLELGEAPLLDGAVRGRGGHMAAHNLAALYGTFGPPHRAAEYKALAAALKTAA